MVHRGEKAQGAVMLFAFDYSQLPKPKALVVWIGQEDAVREAFLHWTDRNHKMP
jgi:hypothetical protein